MDENRVYPVSPDQRETEDSKLNKGDSLFFETEDGETSERFYRAGDLDDPLFSGGDPDYDDPEYEDGDAPDYDDPDYGDGETADYDDSVYEDGDDPDYDESDYGDGETADYDESVYDDGDDPDYEDEETADYDESDYADGENPDRDAADGTDSADAGFPDASGGDDGEDSGPLFFARDRKTGPEPVKSGRSTSSLTETAKNGGSDAPFTETAKTPSETEAENGKELENTLARVQAEPARKVNKKAAASYREKILRHKLRRYRRAVMAVLLVMFILTAGVLLWMQRGYRSAELQRLASLSADDEAGYAVLNGSLVQYGANGAVCIDSRGETCWTVSYEMQQPIVSISGNVIAIANRGGSNVYVMNADGLMGTIQTMLPIQNIAAAGNGEVAVVMSDSSTTWVRLYTARGREISYLTRTMEENGYPLALAVSPDGETLCLSSLQISNETVKTNISFYNFGSAGRNANEYLVDSADFIDETVPYVRYLDGSTCVGVSDKRLIIFRQGLFRSPGSLNVLFSENLQGVFSDENFTGLLFTNTGGGTQYRLDIYNRLGRKQGSVSFTMKFTDIAIVGDKVYINNEHQILIYTLEGKRIYDGELSGTIRTLVPGASLSDLMVVVGGELDRLRLR